jgi:broad specificity phosphatase PhoE
VRHGITAWNAEGRLQGQSDIPLSDAGRAQARSLGRRLSRAWDSAPQGDIPIPLSIYTSDLDRARETARLMLAPIRRSAPPVHVTPLLRERAFGPWEGLTTDEARAKFGSARSYRNEGEAHLAVWERMGQALGEIWNADAREDDGGAALIVGHGGSLRQLICLCLAFPIEAARHFHLDNTALSVVEMRGVDWRKSTGRLLLWNDTAHLFYDGDV